MSPSMWCQTTRWRPCLLAVCILAVVTWSALWTRTGGLHLVLQLRPSIHTPATPLSSTAYFIRPTQSVSRTSEKTKPTTPDIQTNSIRPGSSPLPSSTTSANYRDSFLPCHWKLEDIPRPIRTRVVLRCNRSSAGIFYEKVSFASTPVTSLAANDACLKRVTKELCRDVTMRVPRVVHYIWFRGGMSGSLQFHTFVSVLSAARFIKPCLVLFHGGEPPTGLYWDALLQLVPNLLHVKREPQFQVMGQRIALVEHSADVARLQVLLELGGVYIDIDQYVLRPLEDLRNHSVVIATEDEGYNCGNAMILSEPGAEFLKLWLDKYSTFNASVWGYHSTVVPYLLSWQYPQLVHVVSSFYRPNWHDIQPLYDNTSYVWSGGDNHTDWGGIHAIHLYFRFFYRYFITGDRLDTKDCSIGEMTRYILYGNKNACMQT